MHHTILLTGATGFLAKHILVRLLNHGHSVRGSLRSLGRDDEVRAAVVSHLDNVDFLENLSFIGVDLAADGGWDEAMHDVTLLMHTASPFPMTQPKNEDDLIRPAVDGTLRAMRAAQKAGVKQVILTSSTAAVSGVAGTVAVDESDWTDVTDPGVTPYVKSKTLAERAAWDFVDQHPDMTLTVINPGFILGPALDGNYGTSLRVIERMLGGKDPAVPKIGFSTVDVRDVADMHVAAITNQQAAGKRILSVAKFLWFRDIARILAQAHPSQKIVTRQAPNFLISMLGRFDPAIKQIVPSLGKKHTVSNARAKSIFGMTFRPVDVAVRDAATSVMAAGE